MYSYVVGGVFKGEGGNTPLREKNDLRLSWGRGNFLCEGGVRFIYYLIPVM